MKLEALRRRFTHHRRHAAGCAFAVVLVLAAVILGLPVLATLGAALCGAMMIGMVWMAVRHGGHHH